MKAKKKKGKPTLLKLLQDVLDKYKIPSRVKNEAPAALEQALMRLARLNAITDVLRTHRIQESAEAVYNYMRDLWVNLQQTKAEVMRLQKQLKETHAVAEKLGDMCAALQSHSANQRKKAEEYVEKLGALDTQRQILLGGGQDAQDLITILDSVDDPHLPEWCTTVWLPISAETEEIPKVPDLPLMQNPGLGI